MALISCGKLFLRTSINSNKFMVSQSFTLIQKANISGKILRAVNPKTKPKPFPYNEKTLTVFHQIFDTTSARFDENTKIIVVDGLPAVGKSEFAQALAEEFDMLYIPEANMDELYINAYGIDRRNYSDKFPKRMKPYDICNFFSDPKNPKAAEFQIEMFRLRYMHYLNAIRHVMNTGQGCVMDRSIYSDSVFMETMVKFGYLSKRARSYYNDMAQLCFPELLRPHLAIYLDIPVDECRKRIVARKYGEEAKTITSDYIKELDHLYKQDYLKKISSHAELLIYDWTTPSDIEAVVEDIERIDFDQYDKNDLKLKDWFYGKESSLFERRYEYTNSIDRLFNYSIIPRFDVPELFIDGNDAFKYTQALEDIPGEKYAYGYNKNMGDKNILFK